VSTSGRRHCTGRLGEVRNAEARRTPDAIDRPFVPGIRPVKIRRVTCEERCPYFNGSARTQAGSRVKTTRNPPKCLALARSHPPAAARAEASRRTANTRAAACDDSTATKHSDGEILLARLVDDTDESPRRRDRIRQRLINLTNFQRSGIRFVTHTQEELPSRSSVGHGSSSRNRLICIGIVSNSGDSITAGRVSSATADRRPGRAPTATVAHEPPNAVRQPDGAVPRGSPRIRPRVSDLPLPKRCVSSARRRD
jgi:hypothetical protein